MGGGLMQLVAYGAQDVYLTGDPEITFFKAIYRRHTNFAIESIAQVFNGTTGFGRKATVTISRNGDLVTNTFLEVKLPALQAGWKWNNNIGHNIIEEVELEIGGQRIDRHYGEWLDIWSELTMSEEKKGMFDAEMIGRYAGSTSTNGNARTLYIPLQFFFNRNQGLALPLIALQYHEVKINFTFAPLAELTTPDTAIGVVATTSPVVANDPSMSCYIDYVYLDTEERKRFAQSQHELLIEQLQFTGDETPQVNGSYRLNFNHPVKELVWVVSQPKSGNRFNYGELTDPRVEPVKDANLQLNGHDRFDKREGSYFRLVQPFQHHTRIPQKNIYVYSFAVKPEEHQPSGTCNFSRIDNATLKLTLNYTNDAKTGFNNDDKVKIYATSVNVLRILSGMGGLAYSN